MALHRMLLGTLLFAVCAALATAQLLSWHEVDGRTREQRVRDPRPLEQQPYLGLFLGDQPDGTGVSRCRALMMWQPGPALQADAIRRGDYILALDEIPVQSAREFGEVLDRLAPGANARVRLKRGETESVVTVRVGSRAEWATPLDTIRLVEGRVKPDDLIPPGAGQTRLEQFLSPYLKKYRIRQPMDDLLRSMAGIVERFYGANMLDRVAYAYYRPTRLAELQTSITSPLAGIVDRSKGNPWAVAQPVLAEAAKNIDSPFQPSKPAEIDMAHPAQALKAVSALVHLSYARLKQAFAGISPAQLSEMETSLPWLLEDSTKRLPPAMRARMASTAVDYASLFAAADVISSGNTTAGPDASVHVGVPLPGELAGAVVGEVLAVARFENRWYVYGGPGANEYDLSRIDVVIDPGGNDRYRYSSLARPKVQLVIDWAGNDVYSSAGEIPGPASAMLGVSVIIDRQGHDRYEGGLRSCGAGLMGIGLILDHAGNDTYKGTTWSVGFGRYGFGGIVDLEDPPKVRPLGKYEYRDGSDIYQAQESSEGYGGPRGFGLILDGAGRDLYRLTGSPPAWGDRTVRTLLGRASATATACGTTAESD